ncbi:dienelactone hydrolase family protein [Flavobacterium ardleyense]|uniref:dienelactone hydrolase family protein n=1 Tax=Flavobacterium ardleyense TaxID=2038737 RepID=UPI00298CB1A4|nr:dienelactone hydrolase family protein [Flavobacterium ardleyense]
MILKKLLPLTFVVLMSVQSNAQLKEVAYKDGNQELKGLAIKPAKKTTNNPAVLILPAWKGIDNHSKNVATELSKLGYIAFVADIYGKGNYPKNTDEAGKISGYYKSNPLEYQNRIVLALNELIKSGANPDNIAIFGYCFGGTGAIEAAYANLNLKGVVSFHGGLMADKIEQSGLISPKVLILHGADDPYVAEADIKGCINSLNTRKADWQMISYSDAVHAFTEPEAGNNKASGAAYNKVAADRSWNHAKLFLSEILK